MVERELEQVILHFKGGDMSIGAGRFVYAEGKQGSYKRCYLTIQQLVEAKEIGSPSFKEKTVGMRAYFIFEKPETIDVVIEGLKRVKEDILKLADETKPATEGEKS